MYGHLCSGNLVYKALYKYNDWQISILHIVKTRDAANLLEIEEIRNLNSLNPNGYNMTAGGEGIEGFHHSEETIEKMRQVHIGYHHTEEAREKIRLGNIGNQNTLGKKLLSHSKWMKENNPAKCPEVKEKIRQANIGNQNSKGKNLGNKFSPDISGNKNPMKHINVRIKRLETHIRKLEEEI